MRSQPDYKYYPELDGIRALAIIAVIAYHAGLPYFSRGFVGVDFFFVISGYLITGILAQEALATRRLALIAFFARRIRRLMPAALFMLIVCVALYAWFIPPVVGNYLALARSIVSNAFFASNFFFYTQGNGYFDDSMTQFPLLHTWSLSVEEQYYLLWPLLFWAVVKWQGRPTAQQDNLSLIRRLRVLLWVVFFTSFSFCVYYSTIDSKLTFYLLPARAWEFASGGLLALYLLFVKLPAEVSNKRAWLASGLGTLGVVLCLLSVNYLDGNSFSLHTFGAWAIWPVGGATALIAGLRLNRSGFWSRFFSMRPLVWLGLLSYGWYLWHWPLLTIHKVYALGGDTLYERIAICLIALVAAYASYRFIENPVRVRKPWLFATTKGSLVAGGGMVLVMLLCTALLMVSREYQNLDPKLRTLEAAKNTWRERQINCDVQDDKLVSLKVCGQMADHASYSRPVIVLWGDSHGGHLLPALIKLYPNHAVHVLSFESCPPITDANSVHLKGKPSCAAFTLDTIKHIKSLGSRLEGTYFAARWPSYFGTPSITAEALAINSPFDQQSYEAMRVAMMSTLKQLSDLQVKISVVGPLPMLVYEAPKCLATRPTETCNISRSAGNAYVNPSYLALQEIIKPLPNINLINMMPYFCNETTCFASKNGRSLYSDSNHITATTAKELSDYLTP